MRNKIFLFTISLFFILFFGCFEQVFACLCGKTSTCVLYNFADVIFVGKAINIKSGKTEDTTNKKITHQTETTIFEIDENFLGVKKKLISVKNKSGNSCDISFTQGKTYLIFARGNETQGFTTNFCAGNLPIESADEVIKDLRELPSVGSGGKLFGEIFESLIKRDKDYVPMPNIELKIQEIGGKKRKYSSITDNEGKYQLIVPQGKYEITPIIPEYAVINSFDEEPVFVKDRSCVNKSFSVKNNAQISGKLVDSEGKPIAGIRVEIVSLDNDKPDFMEDDSATTDENGEFTFFDIPSGLYTLSVNFTGEPDEESPFPTTFYPNISQRQNAMVFNVGLGQLIDELIFILPPRIVKQKITGTVFLPDNKPASGITINLQRNESDRTFSYTQTDENGNFELNGFIGEKYNFGVEYYGKNNEMRDFTVKKSVFTLEKNTLPFRLVLEKKLEENQDR